MADGKIVFETAIDQKGMKQDLAGIQHSTGGLHKALGKIGLAIGAAFSVAKVVQFGKACINLGSDLQEVQNVVDVTFGSMSEQVDQFARNALFSAGLSETMAKKYMGTFGSMAKAFGFSTEEAYSMSAALTQLSGDVASFYNISQDEAFTKLKSIFTGETESLKDLGIVMTQAQLDQFALAQGLGKSTKNMTEQEKVALRHKFVLQQLSLASGDFIRTSDGWANQTRILSVQFQQLKATIGQGLINALTPALKVINLMLSKLMALAEAFRSLTARIFGDASKGSGGGAAAAGMDAAAASAENLADGVGGVGKAAKEARRELAGFDELNVLGTQDVPAGGGGGQPAGKTDLAIAEPGAIDAFTDKLSRLQGLNFQPLKDSLLELKEAFMKLVVVFKDYFQWYWENIIQPFGKWTIDQGAPAVIGLLASAIEFLAAAYDVLFDSVKALWPHLEPIAQWFGKEFTKSVQTAKDMIGEFTKALSDSKGDIVGIFDEIGVEFEGAWKSVEWILTLINDTTRERLQQLCGIVSDSFKFIVGWINGALKVVNGMMTGDWSKIWEGAKIILNRSANFLIDIIARMASIFGMDFDRARAGIVNAVNGIIGAINRTISGLAHGVNAVSGLLNNLSFEIPSWVPVYGGSTFGLNIPKITNYPQIPYLAQGAVIPPNREFMAVLGDQSHGRNLEAPEDLIRQIVREENGNGQIIALLADMVELLAQIRDGSGEIDMRKLARLITVQQRNLQRAGG